MNNLYNHSKGNKLNVKLKVPKKKLQHLPDA